MLLIFYVHVTEGDLGLEMFIYQEVKSESPLEFSNTVVADAANKFT